MLCISFVTSTPTIICSLSDAQEAERLSLSRYLPCERETTRRNHNAFTVYKLSNHCEIYTTLIKSQRHSLDRDRKTL